MATRLYINAQDEVPIYRQMVRQLTDGIATGQWVDGERLPSHRDLARELVVAPLTVKKAYDELERGGLVETRRGQGTFVKVIRTLDAQVRTERLEPLVRRLVREADLLGLNLTDLVKLVKEHVHAFRSERKQNHLHLEKDIEDKEGFGG